MQITTKAQASILYEKTIAGLWGRIENLINAGWQPGGYVNQDISGYPVEVVLEIVRLYNDADWLINCWGAGRTIMLGGGADIPDVLTCINSEKNKCFADGSWLQLS